MFGIFVRVYLKTPNAPGQRAFCGVPRHFSLKYVGVPAKECLAQRKKSLAAGHIVRFQIHPKKQRRLK